MGLCFPMRTYNKRSKLLFSNKRKTRLSELMLEKCSFPAVSDLAPLWPLMKQYIPVSPHSTFFDMFDLSLASTEDEEDKLRERRQLGIEKEVDPLPDAQIHTSEDTAPVNFLYKLEPKSAPRMTEINQNNSAISQANCDSEEDTTTQCLQSLRQGQRQVSGDSHAHVSRWRAWEVHKQMDYIHCLMPNLLQITGNPCHW